MTVAPPSQPISSAVRTLTNGLAAFAVARGQQDIASQLRTEVERLRVAGGTLVVAGETSSGKSSLINALLDYPGLSPVDADVATGVHLVFRHATSPQARVFVHDRPDPMLVPLQELAQWASVSGNPENHKRVRLVEVGIPSQVLAGGLALVDTPGVGGLSGAHTEVTLAALRLADALLFVTSAASELTAPELDFIVRSTDRVDTVLFAVTKVDAFPEWSVVVERNRGHLGREAGGRFAAAVIHPVSAAYADHARNLSSSAAAGVADTLRGLSGIDELRQSIGSRVTRRLYLLRLGNLVRLASSLISRLLVLEAVEEPDVDPGLLKELEAEQQRMAELRRTDAVWPTELAQQVQLLQSDLTTEMNRRVIELRRRYEERIASLPKDQLATVGRDIEVSVNALWAELTAMLDARTTVIADEHERLLSMEWAPLASGTWSLPQRLASASDRRPTSNYGIRQPDLLGDVTRILFSGGAGIGLGMLPGTILGLAVTANPFFFVTIPTAIALAGASVIAGRRKVDELNSRQQASRLLNEILEDVRTEVPPILQQELLKRRYALEVEIKKQLAERAQSLASALQQRKQLLNADVATRRKRRDEARGRVAQLEKLAGEARRVSEALAKAAVTVDEEQTTPSLQM